MKFSALVKKTLFHKIDEMSKNRGQFCKNPEKDFKRDRKLGFAEMVKFIILMQGNSIQKELYDYFGHKVATATSSAFVQQRDKLLPEAFSFLFHDFNSAYAASKVYKDYRLVACDGSDIPIATNTKEKENYTVVLQIKRCFILHFILVGCTLASESILDYFELFLQIIHTKNPSRKLIG